MGARYGFTAPRKHGKRKRRKAFHNGQEPKERGYGRSGRSSGVIVAPT